MLLNDEPYSAAAVRITVNKLENYDKIGTAVIFGHNVLTGINDKEGIYFPSGSKVNDSILSFCNLFKNKDKNADKTTIGRINSNCRIKNFIFHGNVYEGLFVPKKDIEGWFSSKWMRYPKVGSRFNGVRGYNICKKFVNREPEQQISHKGFKVKKPGTVPIQIRGQFKFNENTNFLEDNLNKINPYDIISISYKINGTSCVVGNVLYNSGKTFLQRLFTKRFYRIVYSSHRMVRNEDLKPKINIPGRKNEVYDNDDIYQYWSQMCPEPPKGYTYYFEIAGYYCNPDYSAMDIMIQPGYDYGTDKNGIFSRIYIYRITHTNKFGITKNLNYSEMLNYHYKNIRSKYHQNIEIAPLFFYGCANDFVKYNGDIKVWRQEVLEKIDKDYEGKDCFICKNKVPEEGVVVRIEHGKFRCYKHKSRRFYDRQQELIDGGYVDPEDAN
mgnify:CR=1 FL=1